eukprot:6451816-Prymnesium_polylepis.1
MAQEGPDGGSANVGRAILTKIGLHGEGRDVQEPSGACARVALEGRIACVATGPKKDAADLLQLSAVSVTRSVEVARRTMDESCREAARGFAINLDARREVANAIFTLAA